MAAIELIVGNVTTRGAGSLTIMALYKKDAKTKEQPVTSAVRDSKSGVGSLGLVDIKNSSKNARPGQWLKTRMEFPEASFIEFQLMRTSVRFGGGMSAFIIRVRADGPLYRIAIDLPEDDYTTESRGYVEGRFDILSRKEIARLGVACHKDPDTYEASELTGLVSVELLEREVRTRAVIAKTKPTLKTGAKDATGRQVMRVRRVRRIGLS